MNLNKHQSSEALEQSDFETFSKEAFDRGAEFHGPLGLAFEEFRGRLLTISRKNLRADAAWWAALEWARFRPRPKRPAISARGPLSYSIRSAEY